MTTAADASTTKPPPCRENRPRNAALVIPDATTPEFRREIARQVALLDPVAEAEAEIMDFIESVSWFDNDDTETVPADQPYRSRNAARR